MTGSILLFGVSAFALTMDEAKANIDKQATEKKLGAKDHSQAVTTLQGLVDKGVPVEHAYRVVDASINQGIKGKDLAKIASSIEHTAPAARTEAATVAADAMQHRYSARETVRMTNTFGKTVATGAPADKTSQVMSSGIHKGLGADKITAVANTYAGEIKSGTAPDKAVENANHTMDRDMKRDHDRNMDHDKDRDMMHDHMGGGSGMGGGAGMGGGSGMGGSGMNQGAHMGAGAGSGGSGLGGHH
jgi:FKBP-type peptidyl-prolyl cis-trans isomerase